MESLHPRIRILWIAIAVVVALVIGFGLLVLDQWLDAIDEYAVGAAIVVVTLAGVLYSIRLYQRWRFELQDDALYLERGVITFVETAVPYVRVQHVDTQFGPIERALGLSSVVVYTAGTRNADVRVPGLRPERARQLQDRLRRLAAESETDDAV